MTHWLGEQIPEGLSGAQRRAPSRMASEVFSLGPEKGISSSVLTHARPPLPQAPHVSTEHNLGYHTSGPVCGERTLTTAQKLSERTNRAGIISICPLHNIVGV